MVPAAMALAGSRRDLGQPAAASYRFLRSYNPAFCERSSGPSATPPGGGQHGGCAEFKVVRERPHSRGGGRFEDGLSAPSCRFLPLPSAHPAVYRAFPTVRGTERPLQHPLHDPAPFTQRPTNTSKRALHDPNSFRTNALRLFFTYWAGQTYPQRAYAMLRGSIARSRLRPAARNRSPIRVTSTYHLASDLV